LVDKFLLQKSVWIEKKYGTATGAGRGWVKRNTDRSWQSRSIGIETATKRPKLGMGKQMEEE